MRVDLRSDTVTQPTPEMRQAMATAEVGDDVLGDDPTVKQLEKTCADLMGKEAALFVASGTMGNQIALNVHCRPGDAAIFDESAHMVFYEGGAPAAISGVITRTVPSVDGIMDPDAVRARLTRRSEHTPGATLLCLENTHNQSGGAAVPLEMMRTYRSIAAGHGIPVHLDGARMFNAAVALGLSVREIADQVDTLSFCLSKALGAPVGSVLCGPRDFITEARFVRKRLGGGMRQSGILAAAGLFALEHIAPKIPEDHARARRLAQKLVGLEGTRIDLDRVTTNFVMVHTERPAEVWLSHLAELGVMALPPGSHRIRLVLHHQITDEMVDHTAEAFTKVSRLVAASPIS